MTGVRRAAHLAGELLLTGGALLALFLLWQLWSTDADADADAGTAQQQAGVDPMDATATAIVHLPTIGEVRPVNEGVELSVLNRGVLGHYPDTAQPGGVGNFALAGHRTTYGRPLWDVASLSPGDPVVVETATDYYIYRLSELRIVQPEQSEVVAPVPGRPGVAPTERWMVMTACHPKFSASQRIVALSRLDYSQPRSAGLPVELTGG